ncbi:MAG: Ldh family oxidoreductase [Sphingomonadaceae bacterium]
MLVFSASQLEALSTGIFVAVGAPVDIAEHVSRSLVASNLMGHDSHGVLRIPSYLEAIDDGTCLPAARPTVLREAATTAVVDGNWAFGQVTAHHATTVAIEKARSANVAAVSVIRCNHVGRLGEYTEMAAREGMVAFMVGAAFNGGPVTPYGGAGRVLGTNPISFALPGLEGQPVVADIATSVTAEGKLRVARAKHQPVPPDTILDKDGNPTTDAEDFYAGGVLLPMAGHKGYVLSVIADLLGRHMGGGEDLLTKNLSFGNFLMVVNIEAFRPLEQFEAAVGQRLKQIKDVKPAPGFTEVLLPGEPERRTRQQRQEQGVALPEDTYLKLKEIAEKLGVPVPDPLVG